MAPPTQRHYPPLRFEWRGLFSAPLQPFFTTNCTHFKPPVEEEEKKKDFLLQKKKKRIFKVSHRANCHYAWPAPAAIFLLVFREGGYLSFWFVSHDAQMALNSCKCFQNIDGYTFFFRARAFFFRQSDRNQNKCCRSGGHVWFLGLILSKKGRGEIFFLFSLNIFFTWKQPTRIPRQQSPAGKDLKMF